MLKVCALGLVFNKGAFLRCPTNVFDLLIVVTTSASRFATDNTLTLSSLRVFRVIMPMRTLIRIR